MKEYAKIKSDSKHSFEDAIHSVTAERIHADFIITRNIRDFTRSKVMALSPAELIARI